MFSFVTLAAVLSTVMSRLMSLEGNGHEVLLCSSISYHRFSRMPIRDDSDGRVSRGLRPCTTSFQKGETDIFASGS